MSPMITYDSWDPNIREAANSSYKGGACEHLVEDVYIYTGLHASFPPVLSIWIISDRGESIVTS